MIPTYLQATDLDTSQEVGRALANIKAGWGVFNIDPKRPFDEVFDMCFRRASGEAYHSIADDYDLSTERVRQIVLKFNQKLWNHVQKLRKESPETLATRRRVVARRITGQRRAVDQRAR
jgi:hypothetical protein